MIASTPYHYNNYTGQTTQNFIISLAHEIIIIFMGINNQSRSQRPTEYVFQRPYGHTTYSLSIAQHPLFQGNQILIINKPLTSGTNNLFRGKTNNLMTINAYPSKLY